MKKHLYILFYQWVILIAIGSSFLYCGDVGFYDEDEKFSGQRHSSSVYSDPKRKDTKLSSCKTGEDCQTNTESFPFSTFAKEEAPRHMEEHFTIFNRNDLEIVLVIDNSRSMDDNLRKVGVNMSSLLSHIEDKNWRMAFTTTDHGDHSKQLTSKDWRKYMGTFPRYGKFMFLEYDGEILKQKILTKNTPYFQEIFYDTITRESESECSLPPNCQQGYNEQALRAFQSALLRSQTDLEHRHFFKPNTDTFVIIITDEDERLEDPKNATTATDVIKTYNQVFKGQKKRLFGFTISIQDEHCLKEESAVRRKLFRTFRSSATYGRKVGQLANMTGGKNISICSQNYGSALRGISELTRQLIHSLTLKKASYFPQTVQVTLEPYQPKVQWELRNRKIVFSKDIHSGTKVKVKYQYRP